MDYTKIYIAGIMGAGKSVVGELLARKIGWTFLDSDMIIERKTGKTIPEIFDTDGENRFREIETDVIASLSATELAVIALGGGALERTANRAIVKKGGRSIWLDVKPEIAASRLTQDSSRPLLNQLNSVDTITKKLASLLTERRKNYQTADYTVQTGTESPEQIIDHILEALEIPNQSNPWQMKDSPYPIYADHGLLTRIPEFLDNNRLSKNSVVITDEHVGRLYKNQLVRSLEDAGFFVHTLDVAPGEKSKSLETLAECYKRFSEVGLDRIYPVFALGGGVVGDLAGFFAASYLRGIPLIHIPTSLLAQVDSSIGGKVGINLPAGKNLVGDFYNPAAIFMDLNTLYSLPDREWNTGMGEVIKYAFIGDQKIYQLLSRGMQAVWENLPQIVRLSAEEKIKIVTKDFREGNVRRFLNFGHTLGHALEKVTKYSLLNHGEAVYWGMLAALYLSRVENLLPDEKFRDAIDLMRQMDFNIPVFSKDPEAIHDAVAYDKKRISNTVHWVLLKDIGKPVVHTGIDKSAVLDAIHFATDFIAP